jgi:spore maturation protein CgeB
MAANGWSPATRVFEAAGAAACVVSDAWQGIEEFLEPGREVLLAESGEEVAALLEELTRARAREIGRRARRRLLAEHTYARRAEQVEALLQGVRA